MLGLQLGVGVINCGHSSLGDFHHGGRHPAGRQGVGMVVAGELAIGRFHGLSASVRLNSEDQIGIVVSDADILTFFREECGSTFHQCGTCRMGSDPDSVVDPRLRVRGVDGLRVADASIFPSIPSGNTNAPSIMVGERASDLILEDMAMENSQ